MAISDVTYKTARHNILIGLRVLRSVGMTSLIKSKQRDLVDLRYAFYIGMPITNGDHHDH